MSMAGTFSQSVPTIDPPTVPTPPPPQIVFQITLVLLLQRPHMQINHAILISLHNAVEAVEAIETVEAVLLPMQGSQECTMPARCRLSVYASMVGWWAGEINKRALRKMPKLSDPPRSGSELNIHVQVFVAERLNVLCLSETLRTLTGSIFTGTSSVCD